MMKSMIENKREREKFASGDGGGSTVD